MFYLRMTLYIVKKKLSKIKSLTHSFQFIHIKHFFKLRSPQNITAPLLPSVSSYLVKNSNPVSNTTVNSIKLHVTLSALLALITMCPSSSVVPLVKKPNGNFQSG